MNLKNGAIKNLSALSGGLIWTHHQTSAAVLLSSVVLQPQRGGLLLASGSGRHYAAHAQSSERPFVTCRKGKKLVGVYCSSDKIINHPEYLDELQKKLGCNVIIMSGGVNYPGDIRRLTPFPKEEQWVGVGYAENDKNINRCADILHSRGIDIWLYGTGHIDQGNDDRLSPVDFNGMLFRNQPLTKYSLETGTALCFQKSSIIQWQVNSYSGYVKTTISMRSI